MHFAIFMSFSVHISRKMFLLQSSHSPRQNKLKFNSSEHRPSFTELCIAHSLRKKSLVMQQSIDCYIYYRNVTIFYHVAVGSKDQVTLELFAWLWESIVLLVVTLGTTVSLTRFLRSQGDEVIKSISQIIMLLQFGISFQELMNSWVFYQVKLCVSLPHNKQ